MIATHLLGSSERPLRVAVVGSGPSGFYAADALLKAKGVAVSVDMYDRLPMPYGLVRGGVAPDHQSIKRVIRTYERTIRHERFRFFGNVRLGQHVSVADLRRHYDQVVLAIGAEADRQLGIPGEDLQGSTSATAFVGWYNGHPDHQRHSFDLSRVTSVVVVGVGDVAMDVARILAKDPDELADTDISAEALQALRASAVKEVTVCGRRGVTQAKFSPMEIEELGGLTRSDLVVRPDEVVVDPLSRAWLESSARDRNTEKNIAYLQGIAARGEGSNERKVRLRLLVSPIEILGEDGRVTGVRLERNRLVPDDRGQGMPVPRGTGEHEVIPAQLVLRAVGYRGDPVPGIPFDERRGVVANVEGRVQDPATGQPSPGLYVVGWAKRGPTGLIGSNRGDSRAVVDLMLADIAGVQAPLDPDKTPAAAETMVQARQPRLVTLADWDRLDALEVQRGEQTGKVREKFTAIEDALKALDR